MYLKSYVSTVILLTVLIFASTDMFAEDKEDLFRAVADKNYTHVDFMISHGADLNERWDHNSTLGGLVGRRDIPLMIALRNNDKRMFEMLLKNGYNPELFNLSTSPAFSIEVVKDKRFWVLPILKKYDISFSPFSNWRFFENASQKDIIECFKYQPELLQKKEFLLNCMNESVRNENEEASIYFSDRLWNNLEKKSKIKLFHAACSGGMEKLYKKLLESGADPLWTDEDSDTSLYHAIIGNNQTIITSLQKNGLNYSNVSGKLLTSYLYAACRSNKIEMIMDLLKKGAVPDNSSLFAAVLYSRNDIPFLLIESGAKIENPYLLFFAAVLGENSELMDMLFKDFSFNLMQGISADDINFLKNIRNVVFTPYYQIDDVSMLKYIKMTQKKGLLYIEQGDTVLHAATVNGKAKSLQYLLKKDLPIESSNDQKLTPLHALFCTAFFPDAGIKIAEILIDEGADTAYDDKNTIMLGGKVTALTLACFAGNNDAVKLLMSRKINPNEYTNYLGRIPSLTIALEFGNTAAAEILIKNGALKSHYWNNQPAVILSVSNYDTSAVKLLLENGADINARDNDGETALHLAIRNCDVPMVSLLLKYKPDVEILNSDNSTALDMVHSPDYTNAEIKKMIEMSIPEKKNSWIISDRLFKSLYRGDYEEMKRYLDNCSDKINFQYSDKDGNNLLHAFCSNTYDYHGDRDTEYIISYFISKGIDINSRNKKGETPLHLAAASDSSDDFPVLLMHGAEIDILDNNGCSPFTAAINSNIYNKAMKLLTYNPDVNLRGNDDNYPLRAAICSRDYELVEKILEAGADVNYIDSRGRGSLHELVFWDDSEIIELFLGKGASINFQDSEGNTPLALAFKHGKMKSAATLISAGADQETVNSNGRTAADLKQMLIRNGFKATDALHEAVRSGDLNYVKQIVNSGGDVNGLNKFGVTALSVLAESYMPWNFEIISLLAKRGANLEERTRSGFTIFQIAAMRNDIPAMELLLKLGSNLNAGYFGSNILHLCCNKGQEKTVSFLIKAGIDPNQSNFGSDTPLHIAVKYGDTAVLKALLENGADPSLKNRFGLTAFEVAIENNNQEAVDIFNERKKH